jgi:4-amino-4-deoxy-L-arabinose transferase-like glycosyltransferase
LLPQSVAFPHQLLSESISNPMIVFGTAAFVRALESPRRLSSWLLSGLCFGLGGIVRPALSLLPILALGLLAITDRRVALSRVGPAFFAASLVLILGWCLFMFQQTGRFGLGESGQDLGLNFSDSVTKVLLDEGVGPPDGSRPEWLPVRITAAEYFGYMQRYPMGFLNLYSKNVFVMVADSGIGRLYVDLLGFGAEARIRLQHPADGWRAQLNNHGVIAMLKHGFTVAPGTIVAGVVGALAFALVNLGVLASYAAVARSGVRLWKRDSGTSLAQRWCLAYLLIVPLYVVMTSQVVAHAPSRHRSQGEFAWAILACVGWFALRHWRARPDPLRQLLGATDPPKREDPRAVSE